MVNNTGILHQHICGRLEIYILGAQNILKELLELKPWGHCRHLLTSG
jgi:hypothetical protein